MLKIVWINSSLPSELKIPLIVECPPMKNRKDATVPIDYLFMYFKFYEPPTALHTRDLHIYIKFLSILK